MTPAPLKANARQMLVALRETIGIAMDTLRAHKLRTFLTLLGVMLAVTTSAPTLSSSTASASPRTWSSGTKHASDQG